MLMIAVMWILFYYRIVKYFELFDFFSVSLQIINNIWSDIYGYAVIVMTMLMCIGMAFYTLGRT